MNLHGAYYRNGEWVYTSIERWDDLFKLADKAGSKSVRHFLDGGHMDKFIRLGREWVAL